MPISGREAVKILEKHGFQASRQRGSHVVLVKIMSSGKKMTVVPLHRELKKGTIRSIAKLAELDVKLFGL